MTGTLNVRDTGPPPVRKRPDPRRQRSRQATLNIRVLGPPEVFLGDSPVVFERRKTLALLCYLVVTKRPHARSALAVLFWGELPEAQAMANLRKVLTELRNHVGSFMLITRQTVGIDLDLDVNVDTSRFEALLTEGFAFSEEALVESALRIYGDDFLSGFSVLDAPSFEEWSLVQSEHYRSLYCHALEMIATLYDRRGDSSAALAHAERLLSLDPLREGTHRQIMSILARRGQRDAALAQFDACRRVLAEELGVEPSEETTALFERLHRRSGRSEQQLPSCQTELIGYRIELSQVLSCLLDPECRIVSLTGLGGSGKTRVALEAAHTLVARSESSDFDLFADGVHFVDLTRRPEHGFIDMSDMSQDGLTFAIARALKLPISLGTDVRNELFTALSDKRSLLILDGAESFLDAVGILEDILAHAPGVKLLITSRVRLGQDLEWTVALPGLALPESRSELERADASRFFLQCAARSLPSFVLTDAEVPHVIRICELVGGLPLALRLASQWLRVMTCADIADHLEQDLDILSTRRFGGAGRHSSVQAVLDSSFRLATDEEIQALRRLSHINGSFTAATALQETRVTLPSTLSLLDMQMLVRTSERSFTIHPLIRRLVRSQTSSDMSATVQEWISVVKMSSRREPAPERRISAG